MTMIAVAGPAKIAAEKTKTRERAQSGVMADNDDEPTKERA